MSRAPYRAVKHEARLELLIEAFEGPHDALVHAEGSEDAVADFGGEGGEALFNAAASPGELGLVRALRGEVRIFQLEAEGAVLLDGATTGDPSDEGGRDPLQDPGVALPHAQLRPNTVDE